MITLMQLGQLQNKMTRNIPPVASVVQQEKNPSDHLVLMRLPLGLFIIRDSIFIDSCLVHRIEPAESRSQ